VADPRVVSGARRRRDLTPWPVCLRHTFATEALAGGISTFELSRLMGSSIEMIERTYGHLARDSEDAIRTRLESRSALTGVRWASD
jgi:integrase